MSNYRNYTNKELLNILSKRDSLTFLAKTELKKELLKRNISIDQNFNDLEKLIDEETKEIKTFKFLSDIGFKLNWFDDNESFEIVRSSKAFMIDIAAILIGLLFCIIGFSRLFVLISYLAYDISFTIMAVILNVMLTIIGFLSSKMLYNGIDRIIKYTNFKLVINKRNLILRKRFNFKIKETENDISSLQLKEFDNEISLMTGDIEIISSISPSFKAKLTLKELINWVK